MRDSVRVSVESEAGAESVRVHDDAGEVTAGDATFSFSIGGAEPDRTSSPDQRRGDDDDETRDEGTEDPRFVAPLVEVPAESTLRCEALQGRRGTEIILRRETESDVAAWRNSCPHKPKVPIDPGDGAIVDGDQLVCHEHGARFECDDGYCTYGPCRGEALEEIEVEVRDGDVYLSDDRFEACRRLS